MAIERAYGNDSADAMEARPSGNPAAESEEESTAMIPMDILAGQSVEPGDVVRLKVVSVDEENGTVELAYAHGPKRRNSEIDDMASKFDEPME